MASRTPPYISVQHIWREKCLHEEVHHLGGIRDDNSLANLELWSTSQLSGQHVADKLAWCDWFKAQYVDTQLALLV